MTDNNLINYFRNIDNGFCKNCENPKGHMGKDKDYFCYKCAGFELLDREEAIQIINRNKRRTREEFRKIAVKADIFFCLKAFLSIGETFIGPTRPKPESLFIIDPRRIAIANLAVKWLLEDSLEHLRERVPWNNAYVPNMMSLVRTWLEWNKKEKLSDTRYNLGFFITKDEITSFYYTRQFDFYLMSLEKFNITSPDEEIGDNIVKNVQKLHKDLFQDRDKLQKYIRDEYPANVSTVLNSYYTDEVIRPFSFDDLLDKDGKNMRKLLESFDNDLNDLETNNLKLPKIILALLEKLYSYYHNKRSNVIDEDGLVIVRDLNGFYDDIVQENLLVPPLEDFVIASPKNPRNYPFIVKFKRKFIVSPVRLWIGYRLLHYALDKNRINNEMAKKYENESMIEIEDRLIKRGVVIVGKEIFTTKKGVELDLIGYCEDLILIIECKSFHPSPFFMMRRNRRYNNQFKRKIRKVERIKNWIFTKLTDSIPNDGEIKIDVYNHYEKCPAKLVFPMKYHKIDRNRIYYLYITQIKEYHEYHRNDLIQVWSGDL